MELKTKTLPFNLDRWFGPRESVSSTQAILRWRWVIVVTAPLLSLGLELLEGHRLTDVELWLEVLGLGLLVPAVTWYWLTRLAYDIERRTRQRDRVERRRRFMQQLAEHSEWNDLTRFVVQYPSSLFPVEAATLFWYDSETAQLQPIAAWRAVLADHTANTLCPQHTHLCAACASAHTARVASCEFQSCPPEVRLWEDVCLPLTHHNQTVALVRLGCHDPGAMPAEALATLQASAPDLALALVRSRAAQAQISQVRTAAQAYERRQIAQVLHNSLAQQIGYLHLSLDHIAGHDAIEALSEVKDELRHMRDVADEAYRHIRDTLAFLRSQEEADLLQAIVEHAETVTRETGMHVAVNAHGQAWPLPPQLGSKVFSLVQESVNNIIKHAQARQAEISLNWHAHGLNLIVSDNGIGFAVDSATPNGHFGLVMMRESVEELGGTLAVETARDQGTRLRFDIPLRDHPVKTAPVAVGR